MGWRYRSHSISCLWGSHFYWTGWSCSSLFLARRGSYCRGAGRNVSNSCFTDASHNSSFYLGRLYSCRRWSLQTACGSFPTLVWVDSRWNTRHDYPSLWFFHDTYWWFRRHHPGAGGTSASHAYFRKVSSRILCGTHHGIRLSWTAFSTQSPSHHLRCDGRCPHKQDFSSWYCPGLFPGCHGSSVGRAPGTYFESSQETVPTGGSISSFLESEMGSFYPRLYSHWYLWWIYHACGSGGAYGCLCSSR